MSRTPLELKIGGVMIDDSVGGDNLAIALCSYYQDHPDRPFDDPETEHGWGEWVEARCDEAIKRIAKASQSDASEKP